MIALGPVIPLPTLKPHKIKVTQLLHTGPAVMDTGLIFILPSVQ